MEALHQLAHTNPYWSLEEFAMVANQWLPRVLPEAKANTRVREEVNPRLIRQYTTWGLVDAPGKEGREARYAYRHLLQLLVTRRLLAEGYGTAVINKLMAGQDDRALESMLAGGAPMTMATESPANPAVAFLQGLTQRRSAPSPSAPPPPAPLPAAAPLPPPRMAAKKAAAPAPSFDLAYEEELESADYAKEAFSELPSTPLAPAAVRWTRHELAPGLELNIRDDIRLPPDRQALLDEIARHLDAHSAD